MDILKSKSQQAGITFIGFLMVAGLFVFFAFIGMRLLPLYNEQMKVVSSMKSVAESTPVTARNSEIVKALLKNFEVQDLDQFYDEKTLMEVLTIKETDDGKIITMAYQKTNPLLAGLEILLNIEHSETLGGVE